MTNNDKWLAVLLHGEQLADALTAAGVQVTTDLDSIGRSGLPTVLIGHFTGGPVAARYAQLHADRLTALVLVSPVLGMWDKASEELASLLDEVNFGDPLGDLPTLWLHGDADEVVPISDTRAGTDRIRGMGFEENIYPGKLDPAVAVADIIEFVAGVQNAR